MQWRPQAPLIERLRSTSIETIHHEGTVGFLAQEPSVEHREVHANRDGPEAATLIEQLQDRIEGMALYVQHDAGCEANDLDYLDRSPCTCGLRRWYNPNGQKDEAQAA